MLRIAGMWNAQVRNSEDLESNDRRRVRADGRHTAARTIQACLGAGDDSFGRPQAAIHIG